MKSVKMIFCPANSARTCVILVASLLCLGNILAGAASNKTSPASGTVLQKTKEAPADDEEPSSRLAAKTGASTSPEPSHSRDPALPEEDDEELSAHRVELWLDEHRPFAHHYFVHKATRQMVDDWLRLHLNQSQHSTSTPAPAPVSSTTTFAPTSTSTSTTPAPPRVSPAASTSTTSSTTTAPSSVVQAKPDASPIKSSTSSTASPGSINEPTMSSGQPSASLGQHLAASAESLARPPLANLNLNATHLDKPPSSSARPGSVAISPSAATTLSVPSATRSSDAPAANRSELATIISSPALASSPSRWPLNVSGDHMKASTPWSSSTDLSTRGRQSESSGWITVGSAGSKESPTATTLLPASPAIAATISSAAMAPVSNASKPINVSSLSLVEMIKDMNDEHMRIEDNVKEQASSLRHFIIICSVLVVLATSLVIALLITLCK